MGKRHPAKADEAEGGQDASRFGKAQLRTVRVKVSDLREDLENPRSHDERNIAAIMSSIKEFGQVEPLLVNARTMKIIAGHGRATAMQRLGIEEADVNLLALDEKRASALAVILNRTAELAGWHYDRVAVVHQFAKDEGIDLGFTDDEMKAIKLSLAWAGWSDKDVKDAAHPSNRADDLRMVEVRVADPSQFGDVVASVREAVSGYGATVHIVSSSAEAAKARRSE